MDCRKRLDGLLDQAYLLGADPYQGDCVLFVKRDHTQLRARPVAPRTTGRARGHNGGLHPGRRLLRVGYPVLFNVTVTGLGGTTVEPHVPAPDRVVAAVAELARHIPAAAILSHYDPIFVSARYDEAHHRACFGRLLDQLAPYVDRVAVSFLTR